jgi:3-hydroxyacyl-[acyl-carrier-protein] dehydratase
VLLVESWCQAAGLLTAWHQPSPDALSSRVMLVASVTRAWLPDTVMPGAVIEHRIRKVREVDQTVIFDGESTVGGRVILDVERVVMTLRPAEELRPVTEGTVLGESELRGDWR